MKSPILVSLVVLSIVLLCSHAITPVTAAPSLISTFNFTNVNPKSTAFAFEFHLGRKIWPFPGTDDIYKIDITLNGIEITSENIYGVPTTVMTDGSQLSEVRLIPSNYTALAANSPTTTTISFNPLRFPRWTLPHPSNFADYIVYGFFQGRILNPATASYSVKVEWVTQPGEFDNIPTTALSPPLTTMAQSLSFDYTLATDFVGKKHFKFQYKFTGLDRALWDYPDDQRRVDSFSITDTSPYTTTARNLGQFRLIDRSKPSGCSFNGINIDGYISPWAQESNTLSVDPDLFSLLQVGDFTFTCSNIGLYPPTNTPFKPPYFVRALAVAVRGKRYGTERWVEKP